MSNDSNKGPAPKDTHTPNWRNNAGFQEFMFGKNYVPEPSGTLFRSEVYREPPDRPLDANAPLPARRPVGME